MKDFLIMLYLAFTLAMTCRLTQNLGYLFKYDKAPNLSKTGEFVSFLVPSILWAIWYIYIIH